MHELHRILRLVHAVHDDHDAALYIQECLRAAAIPDSELVRDLAHYLRRRLTARMDRRVNRSIQAGKAVDRLLRARPQEVQIARTRQRDETGEDSRLPRTLSAGHDRQI